MNYHDLIGKRIKLIGLTEEKEGKRVDLTGVVEDVLVSGDYGVELLGTWGQFAIRPEFDKFEILDTESIGNIEVYDEWFHTSIS